MEYLAINFLLHLLLQKNGDKKFILLIEIRYQLSTYFISQKILCHNKQNKNITKVISVSRSYLEK